MYFAFEITIPFIDRYDIVKCVDYKPFDNYAIELQLDKSSNLIGFEIRLRLSGDHRGFDFSVSLFGFDARFAFYDMRHE